MSDGDSIGIGERPGTRERIDRMTRRLMQTDEHGRGGYPAERAREIARRAAIQNEAGKLRRKK